jgi:uncharacterized protein YodC (DUF2158 family)
MELLKPGEIVALKNAGPRMTIIAVDNSSGEATCVWFKGKERKETNFDVATLRKVNQRKPDLRIYARSR